MKHIDITTAIIIEKATARRGLYPLLLQLWCTNVLVRRHMVGPFHFPLEMAHQNSGLLFQSSILSYFAIASAIGKYLRKRRCKEFYDQPSCCHDCKCKTLKKDESTYDFMPPTRDLNISFYDNLQHGFGAIVESSLYINVQPSFYDNVHLLPNLTMHA